MTIADLRAGGMRSILASCECGHFAEISADRYLPSLAVPDVRWGLRCSKCGRRPYETRPAWHESWASGMGKSKPLRDRSSS